MNDYYNYYIKLSYLETELELAEQDLYDHDGSELDAALRIKQIKQKIKEFKKWDRLN